MCCIEMFQNKINYLLFFLEDHLLSSIRYFLNSVPHQAAIYKSPGIRDWKLAL